MRAEISKLQRRLKTTTVYVTHDQVEAMTMGHRIAVLRPCAATRGKLPDAGRHADGDLRQPAQPLHRGLHRHAADEPAQGQDHRRRPRRDVLRHRAAGRRRSSATRRRSSRARTWSWASGPSTSAPRTKSTGRATPASPARSRSSSRSATRSSCTSSCRARPLAGRLRSHVPLPGARRPDHAAGQDRGHAPVRSGHRAAARLTHPTEENHDE